MCIYFPSVSADFENTSYGFVENKGQLELKDDNEVLFYLESRDFVVHFHRDGLSFQFAKTSEAKPDIAYWGMREEKTVTVVDEVSLIWMKLEGANEASPLVGKKRRPDPIRYFSASEPVIVSHYDQVVYEEIYPGIDWIIKHQNGAIKHEFLVRPGADPSQIKFEFDGAEKIKLNRDGGYTIKGSLGTISEDKPFGIQGEKEIPIDFVLNENQLHFEVGEYDTHRKLVIDPELNWATYYGGTENETSYDVTTDAEGNVYMVGQTLSLTGIAFNGFQNELNAGNSVGNDAFLVKFDVDGNRIWSTYYGGNGGDVGYNVVVDGDGNVLIAGDTNSWLGNLSSPGSHQENSGGWIDGFVAKFDSDGNRLWGTFVGGQGSDCAYGLDIDEDNNIYVSGYTDSVENIALDGFKIENDAQESICFLMKFSPDGEQLWGTYYGEFETSSTGCATDSEGNVYLCGYTGSQTGIALNGHQNLLSEPLQYDGYMAKFDPDGNRIWGTYYGGPVDEYAYNCHVDANDNAYLLGTCRSETGIAFNGHQNTYAGAIDGNLTYGDAFIVKFDSDGNRQWGTYYGGDDEDSAFSCGTDPQGNVFLFGMTRSETQIASFGAFDEVKGNPPVPFNDRDIFIAKFNENGERQWGTYYGGTFIEFGGYGHVTANGTVYVAFRTNSEDMSFNGFQSELGGQSDGFLASFDGCGSASRVDQNSCGPFTWAITGETYEESGEYFGLTTDSEGCDSLITLNLSISNSSLEEFSEVACESFLWDENGVTYSESGEYEVIYQNQLGCDSIIRLSLEINPSTSSITDQTACDEFEWDADGTTYSSSGTYEAVLTNFLGCDSLARLNLTINESTASEQSASACLQYTWDVSGDTYNQSGDYQEVLINAAGCDSVVTLQLTINDDYLIQQEQTACDSAFWESSGQWYFNSGFYSSAFSDVNGCDSIIELDLTINSSTSSSQEVSSCSSFTWDANGQTYSESGVYETTLTNSAGCPETVSLQLEILSAFETTEVVESCLEYIWPLNGVTYDTSGLYTETVTAQNGCDSISTIDLEVFPLSTSSETVRSCEPYQWEASGETYSETGSYLAVLTDLNGCDSVLVLDFNYAPISILDEPHNVEGTYGSEANFTLESSEVDDVYQWQKKEGDSFVDLVESEKYVGVSTSSLLVTMLDEQDHETTYRCVVSRLSCSLSSEEIALTVLVEDPFIFPNPTRDRFTLVSPDRFLETTVRLFDTNGKLITERVVNKRFTNFEVSALQQGVYQLQLDDSEILRVVLVK